MYDQGDKISFGALKDELKRLIWPNGVPENLTVDPVTKAPGPIERAFEDAFIDLQRYVSCLQQWHTDVYAQCATYFKCGLTVLDKPRGKIRRIRTFEGQFCDPVTLTPAPLEQLYCWSRRFIERIDAPANVGMPALPMGFKFADASTDSQFGRALVGLYAFDRERIYIAPWIQSLESIVIEWDGLKRKFADTDLFPDEQDFKRAIRLFVQSEFSRDFERDWAGKEQFRADYESARADLIYDCEQENRLPKAEPCKLEREYLWDHRLEDDSPDTAEKQTVIALFGDYGSGDDPAKAVAALVKSWSPLAIVTLGDNHYQDTGLTYDQTVGALYRKFIFPYSGSQPLPPGETDAKANAFWPCLGNHDLDTLSDYLAYFSGITPGNGRFYDVVVGPVHFFIINDGLDTAGDNLETAGNDAFSVQASWFRSRVETSLARWKVAIVHQPPYCSPANHTSTEVLRWIKGVDLVISGHNHNYERLLANGQTYLVAGTGGRPIAPFIGSPIPESQFQYSGENGALKVSVTCSKLIAQFVNLTGNVIDTVTLGA